MGAVAGPTRLVPRGGKKVPRRLMGPGAEAGTGCRAAQRIGRKISVSVSVFSSSDATSQFSHIPARSRLKS